MLIDYNDKNSVTITCKSNEKIQIVHTTSGLFVSVEIQDKTAQDVLDKPAKLIKLQEHKNNPID